MADSIGFTLLQEKLLQAKQGDRLVLNPAMSFLPGLKKFIKSLPERQLTIDNVKLVLEPGSSPPVFKVTGDLSREFPIPGIEAGIFQGETIRLEYSPKEAQVIGRFYLEGCLSGLMDQEGQAVKVMAEILEDGSLKLDFTAEMKTKQVSLARIGAYATNSNLVDDLIQAVDLFETIPLTQLDLSFGLLPQSPTRLQFTTDTSALNLVWPVTDKIRLENLGLTLWAQYAPVQLQYDWERQELKSRLQASYGGDLHAIVGIRNTRYRVQMSFSTGDDWELQLEPADGALPVLPALLELLDLDGAGLRAGLESLGIPAGLDAFALESIAIGFGLRTKLPTFIDIRARITIYEIVFRVELRLPDVYFAGDLDPQTPVDLNQIIGKLLGPEAAAGFPATRITRCDIEAYPTQGEFGLGVAVETDVEFQLGACKFVFNQLNLELARSREGVTGRFEAGGIIAEVDFLVSAAFLGPAQGWEFQSYVAQEHPMDFKKIIQSLIPAIDGAVLAFLPEIQLSKLSFGFKTGTQEFRFEGHAVVGIKIGATQLPEIQGLLVAESALDSSQHHVFSLQMEGDSGEKEIWLSDIVQAFLPAGTPKLQEVPDIAIKKLRFSLNSKGYLQIYIQASAKVGGDSDRGNPLTGTPKLGLGSQQLLLENIEAELTRKENQQLNCRINVQGSGQLLDELQCPKFDFSFTYDDAAEQKQWSLSGSASVLFFNDIQLDLHAAYDTKENQKYFRLGFELAKQAPGLPAQPLIRIPGAASLNCDTIELGVKTAAAGTEWDLTATGDLEFLDPFQPEKALFSLKKGKLALAVGTGTGKFKLEFTAAEARFKSPRISYSQLVSIAGAGAEPAETQTVELGFDLDFKTITLEKTGVDWSFQSRVDFYLFGLPSPLDQLFPAASGGMAGTFELKKVNQQYRAGIGVKGNNNQPLTQAPIPDLFSLIKQSGATDLPLPELGAGSLALQALNLSLGSSLALEITAGIGLPSKLNELIGLKPHQIIKTYDGTPDSYIRVNFTIGTDTIKGTVLDSPFQAIKGIKDLVKMKKAWYEFDLDLIFGQTGLGLIRVQKPDLAFDLNQGSFSVDLGYEIDPERGAKIPLFPLKALLELLRLPELAGKLPAGIPVGSIELTRWENDKRVLNLEGFKEIARWLELPIPDEFWAPLDVVKDLVDGLPERFKGYLSINIPQSLRFKVDITSDGGVTLDIATDQEHPLQFMGPLSLSSPTLTGIRLRRLAFGAILGGNLLKLELDMEYDNFDILTLAAAIALKQLQARIGELPPEYQKLLPEAERFQTTIIVEDLLALIIYQTEIPIPIPLFYKRLEFKHLSLDGGEVGAAVYFPKPSLNAMKALKILSELRGLLMEGKDLTVSHRPIEWDEAESYQRAEGSSPSDLNLVFSAGPFFWRLPKFLGSGSNEFWQLKQAAIPEVEARVPLLSGKLQPLIGRRFYSAGLFWKTIQSLAGEDAGQITGFREYLCEAAKGHKELGVGLGVYDRYQLVNGLDLFAICVNAIKKGSINYLIQSLHIKHRLGIEQLHLLGIFQLQVVWALTTPLEFEEAYRKIKERYQQLALENSAQYPSLTKETPAQELLELLADKDSGRAVTAQDEGMALFLKGGLQIGPVMTLEAALGLVAGGPGGIRTGLSFYGNLADLIEVKLLGFIKIATSQEISSAGSGTPDLFGLAGHSSLRIPVLNHEIFAGDLCFKNNTLTFHGKLDLFPAPIPFQVKGDVSGYFDAARFSLTGDVSVTLGGLILSATKILISQQEFYLEAVWLGATLRLDLKKTDQGVALAGRVEVSLLNLKAILDLAIKTEDSSVVCYGYLTQAIDLAGILKISDASGQKGPYCLVDTTKMNDPNQDFLALSGRVSLFNLVDQTVDAHVKSGALSFLLNYNVAPLGSFTLECFLRGMESFTASTAIHFAIPDHTEIRLVIDSKYIGTVKLINTRVDATLNLSLAPGSFLLEFDGQLYFEEVGLTIHYRIQESFSDLGQLVVKTIEYMAANSWGVFQQIFGDPVKLFQCARKGVVILSENIGEALTILYNLSDLAVAQLLSGVGYLANEAAAILKNVFGYGSEASARVLSQVFGIANEAIAEVLKGAGYAAEEVGKVLRNVFGLAGETTAQILTKVFGIPNDAVAQVLKASGYAADEVARVLRYAFGYAAETTARTLEAVFGITSDIIAQVLQGAGYTAVEVGRVLRDVYNFSCASIMGILKGAFGLSGEVTAEILKSLGFAANEVGDALVAVFGFAVDQAGRVLQGIGYALEAIKNWGGAAISWIEDTTKKVVEAIGDAIKFIFSGW